MIAAAILFMSALGFVLSLALATAARIFYVEEDPRLAAVKAALPGINCGACGYVGCEGAAKALLQGKAPLTVCASGGEDVIEALAQVMGLGSAYAEREKAAAACLGGQRADRLYHYNGARDCRAVALLYGGFNSCADGCLGGGTCVAVCRFNAIRISARGAPQIDASRCRGCGQCVAVCPRNVIELRGMAAGLLHLNETDECLAPCRQRCPVQVNVPLFVRQMQEGRMVEALMTVKARNPFPMTVGRVCPHPCEHICRRNIADQGVAVAQLERWLGEWELKSGNHVPMLCLPDTQHRVAVVGGGPAGLACAYFLRRLGHRPTILEAMPMLGGMLRYGIPAYRLPRHVVDWEIDGILSLGMDTRLNVKLGRDFTLKELQRSGFEAIFVGVGAWTVPHLCVPGEYATGVYRSLDFLSRVGSIISTLQNKRIVVIGESNTAMDCARLSVRLGAESVTVICPCRRKDMTARKRDVERADQEGVRIRHATQPVRVVYDDLGCVTRLIYRRLEVIGDEDSKNVRYAPLAGTDALLPADLVIIAYERKPNLTCLLDGEDAELDFRISPAANLNVERNTSRAASTNIFAAGDLHTGRATVISAVAGGRLAARSIHYLLTSGKIPVPANLQRKLNPHSILKDIRLAAAIPRTEVAELSVARRCKTITAEVVPTITAAQAATECRRCLQCGTYCYDHDW